MEYSEDTPSTTTLTTINNKVCKCNLTDYYCYCYGENALLDYLKIIGAKNLNSSVYVCAAQCGHLEVLKWMYSECYPLGIYAHGYYAIINGHLNIVKWLETKYLLRLESSDLCHLAAKHNQLNILIWLRTQNPPYYWDRLTCLNAAENGHLEILKWSINKNAPVNFNNFEAYEIEMSCLKYLFEINKIATICNTKNLQQIKILKVLMSGVI